MYVCMYNSEPDVLKAKKIGSSEEKNMQINRIHDVNTKIKFKM